MISKWFVDNLYKVAQRDAIYEKVRLLITLRETCA